MTPDRKAAEECDHQWTPFCEGERCARCGVTVGARFYSKNGGWYTGNVSNAAPSAPVGAAGGDHTSLPRRVAGRIAMIDDDAENWIGDATRIIAEAFPAAAKKLSLSVEDQRALNDALRISAPAAEAFPTPAPVTVEEIVEVMQLLMEVADSYEDSWTMRRARALLARLKDAPDDAGEPVKRDVGFDPKTQASARPRDGGGKNEWSAPMIDKKLIESLQSPVMYSYNPEQINAQRRQAASALASLTAASADHDKTLAEWHALWSAMASRAEVAEAALASLTVKNENQRQVILSIQEQLGQKDGVFNAEQLRQGWLERAEQAEAAIASLTAENKRLENALASLWDTPETATLMSLTAKLAAEVHECEGHIHNNANLILEKRAAEAERDAFEKEIRDLKGHTGGLTLHLGLMAKHVETAEAERDAALAELTEKDEALGRLIRTCERAQETRDAALVEAKRLRDALEEAEGELVNLLPHIPQACKPGHEGFIDAHVEAAMTAIRAVLAKTQEPR